MGKAEQALLIVQRAENTGWAGWTKLPSACFSAGVRPKVFASHDCIREVALRFVVRTGQAQAHDDLYREGNKRFPPPAPFTPLSTNARYSRVRNECASRGAAEERAWQRSLQAQPRSKDGRCPHPPDAEGTALV